MAKCNLFMVAILYILYLLTSKLLGIFLKCHTAIPFSSIGQGVGSAIVRNAAIFTMAQ